VCNVACSTCVTTVNNCVRCANSYYFVRDNITIPNCVATCANGYIYDNTVLTGNN
jgi:hypothetical protein